MEKLHTAVARSTFSSQNVQNTAGADHFLKFRCGKIVEKWHAAVAPSTFTSQNVRFAPLLEVPMSQRCSMG